MAPLCWCPWELCPAYPEVLREGVVMLSQEQELCQGTELWELKGDVTAAMGTVLIFSQDYHFVKGG